jgi:hypothetical protein
MSAPPRRGAGPYRTNAVPRRAGRRGPRPVPAAFVLAWFLVVGQAVHLLAHHAESASFAPLAAVVLGLGAVTLVAELTRRRT